MLRSIEFVIMSVELELGLCNSSPPLMIWGRWGLKVRSIRKSWTRDYHLVITSSPVQWNAALKSREWLRVMSPGCPVITAHLCVGLSHLCTGSSVRSYLDHTLKSSLTADGSALALKSKCCMDALALVPNCLDISDPSWWCLSVSGLKCLYTVK